MKIYLKNRIRNISLFLFLGISIISNAQSTTKILQDLSIEVQYSLEQHDKRLFEFPSRATLLSNQPEHFGTHQFKIGFLKRIFQKNNFEMNLGVGYAREQINFNRPYNLSFYALENSNDSQPYLLVYTRSRYDIDLLYFPVEFRFFNLNKFEGGINLVPQFDLNRRIGTGDFARRTQLGFRFYSLEINPTFGYEIGKLRINLSYRLLHLKKIDRLIFFNTLFETTDPPDKKLNESFELYNPVKFIFSVGYVI